MNANKFAPLYTTAPYHLVMSGAEHRYELLIEEAAGDDIAVVVPADNSSLPVTEQPAAEELVLPPKGSGKIALLIDDGGMNLALAERLLNIGVPVALAILPHLPHSGETAALVHEYEQTVFLHFPMEPLSYPSTDPGQGAVLVNMPELLIEQIVKQNVENLGGLVDGYNNHMGSALTEDATKMAQVFEHMKPYSTNFVDSNTSAKTVALATCQETAGYKCGLNRKFLDNENDHGYIRQKLYEMAAQSNKGGIITIGHLRPDTIAVLEEVVPQLQALGYQFVPITSLME
jgi:polysaccharide deacetylase 2 family uncharacterized protein YibQ